MQPGTSCTSRRRVLAALGGAVATAGCGGNGGDGGDGGSPSEFEPALTLRLERSPDEFDFNPVARVNFPASLLGLAWTPLAVGRIDETGIEDVLLEDHHVDGAGSKDATLTLAFGDQYRWWNGEPVTARDLYVEKQCQRLGTAPEDRLFSAIELRGEREIAFEFAEAWGLPSLLGSVVGWHAPAYRGEWETTLEALESASTRAEREATFETSARGDRIGFQPFVDGGLGHGPFRVADWSASEVRLRRASTFPGEPAVEKVRLVSRRGTASDLLYTSGVLDAGPNPLPPILEGSLPASSESLSSRRGPVGLALVTNWDHDHLGRVDVRRAMLSALPCEDLYLERPEARFLPFTLQGGLVPSTLEAHLDAADRDALYDYPAEADHDLAATFMRRAGYRLEGDRWTGPDGSTAAFTLTRNASSRGGPPTQSIQTLEAELEAFGIGVEIDEISGEDYQRRVPLGQFDALVTTQRRSSPYELLQGTYLTLPPEDGLEGDDPHRDTSGKPYSVTVPRADDVVPVVEDGIDPAGPEVSIPGVVRGDYGTATSFEAASEAVGVLARWYNAAVPNLLLGWWEAGTWGDVEEYDWPGSEHAAYRTTGNAVYALLRQGAVARREE